MTPGECKIARNAILRRHGIILLGYTVLSPGDDLEFTQGRGGYASIADKKVTLTANEKPRDLAEKWRMGRKGKKLVSCLNLAMLQQFSSVKGYEK